MARASQVEKAMLRTSTEQAVASTAVRTNNAGVLSRASRVIIRDDGSGRAASAGFLHGIVLDFGKVSADLLMECGRRCDLFLCCNVYRQLWSLRFTDVAVNQRCPLFPRLVSVGELDPLGNGGMRRLKDQEEGVPIGRNITPLNILGKLRRRRVILMSQFKAETVGFVLNMTGD